MSNSTNLTNLDQLIAEQEQEFLVRNPKSASTWAAACDSMPGGVTSSWSSTRPIPVWIDRGHGSHVWDVDGNEYVDYHAGYGVNVVGHANPLVVEAVQRRVTLGTHFAQPTPDCRLQGWPHAIIGDQPVYARLRPSTAGFAGHTHGRPSNNPCSAYLRPASAID